MFQVSSGCQRFVSSNLISKIVSPQMRWYNQSATTFLKTSGPSAWKNGNVKTCLLSGDRWNLVSNSSVTPFGMTHHYSTASTPKAVKDEKVVSYDMPTTDLVDKIAAKRVRQVEKDKDDYLPSHPMWDDWEVDHTQFEHRTPKNLRDRLAYAAIRTMRFNFDWVTGFNRGERTMQKWINRLVFLETVAGIPGSCAAVIRHLNSLRRMERDKAWIDALMAEATNERMHLLTFMEYKQPTLPFRTAVVLSQGIFWNFFFVSYLISPRFCHRMVGYLEEEAVLTYTKLIGELEGGKHKEWFNVPVPPIAKKYWMLRDDATVVDLMKVIRADEAHHRDCNHVFAELKRGSANPFRH